MPKQPPVFRPPGWAPRKAWAPRGGKPPTERIRGRAGQKLRAEVLLQEPLCRVCLAAGRHVRAEVVDHVIPLAWGGSETRGNRQALCHPCHDAKSALERATGGAGGAAHPDWLKPAAVDVTIVCGPPCAGKAAWVQEQAGWGDLVIDLDAIRRTLSPGYRPWVSPFDAKLLSQALRYRNHLLGTLARPGGAPAWLIVMAPSEGERDWWEARLGGEVILLDPGEAECRRRAAERGLPAAQAAIEDWYARSQRIWEKE